MNGYIYIIKSKEGFKIGKATDYKSRFSSIKTSSPIELKLHKVYYVKDADSTEKRLHGLVKGKHIRGEWFDLERDDLYTIETFILVNRLLIRHIHKLYEGNTKYANSAETPQTNTLTELQLQVMVNNLATENNNLKSKIEKLEWKLFEHGLKS